LSYFHQLERELVVASARMSASHRRARRNRLGAVALRSGRPAMSLAVALAALTGTAVAAIVTTSGGTDEPASRAMQNLSSVSGPHALVRAFGIDPASATPAFKTSTGEVSIVQARDVACLLQGANGDQCYLKTNIAAGRGFSILDDCSVGSAREMTIQGFAPAGVSEVHVVYSDGSVPLTGKVVRGAYLMTSTTPEEGRPYPAGLRYLDARGADLSSEDIPAGDHLCPAASP
jgi:hypothetical protein